MLAYVPNDHFPSPTSITQTETEDSLAPFLPKSGDSSDERAVPPLDRNVHLQYLVKNMVQGLPSRYTSFDASQAWLLFWTLQSFATLQIGMDPGNKQKAINTIMAMQHPDGGFGGGPGQLPHLLPTYASVCALAIAGRPGEGGGWEQIDRGKLYNFFMSLKQPDGSFRVSTIGEVDTRGTYGLLCAATLLNLLTPELVENTAQWIVDCQCYEGGFSSESYLGSPPHGEAHGGYTFCGLAGWVMLQPFLSAAPEPKPQLNLKSLLRWLVQMQGLPADIGGFRGRCNKLVDGCYSWWVGGSFALLETLGINSPPTKSPEKTEIPVTSEGKEEGWEGHYDGLYDRAAIQEYILCAGQHKPGGLRDKPGKNSDPYHTLSCLSGLSSAQHRVYESKSRREELESVWSEPQDIDPGLSKIRREVFLQSLSYSEDPSGNVTVGGSPNRLNPQHPVFNLTMTHVEGIMGWSYGQQIPQRKG
ncbi:terpenoid cyclases/Protein prenyltransferase [Flagelloscypha sp. PMI_526]|nr:terpenoid cyclases/Protein prenyltransferase [Flagelloscypha sp. PMI_526]